MQDDASFGRWLQRRRKALDLTQAELAQQVGVAANTIHKIETDARRPSKQVASHLAEVLKISQPQRPVFQKVARGDLAIEWLSDATPRLAAPQEHQRPTLPAQLTPFIGRQTQIALIHQRLRDPEVRLLTLTGAGGTGKTRLALQAAAEIEQDYVDGVWFVDLSSVREPSFVASAIAIALDVKETSARQLVETLKAFLQHKHALLLLDNFEQVVAAAPLLTELLRAAPNVQLLVTSRMVLGLYGEHNLVVPPLTLPEATDVLPLEKLDVFEAVTLFIQRAQAADHTFFVTSGTAPAIVEICRRVDGLPLSIELAAARVKLLPPEVLLQRLTQSVPGRLMLLSGGSRDVSSRQRTLRNTIEWSYQLLTATEQRLFARLAVFVGGWTLEAAETICSTSEQISSDLLDSFQSLLDKSLLVQADSPERELRFRMLETIREYAWERLRASDDFETVQERHASYYLTRAETLEPKLRSGARGEAMARLEWDRANLEAALTWSINHPNKTKVGLRLAGALSWFWYLSGHWSDGNRWLLEVLAHSELSKEHPAAYAKVLFGAAVLASYLTSDYVRARAWLETSTGLYRQVGDRHGLGFAYALLGVVALYQGDFVGAWTSLEESVRLWRELQDPWGLAFGLSLLGIGPQMAGDLATAQMLFEESLALWRKEQDPWGMMLALGRLGEVAFAEGDFSRAHIRYRECLALAQNQNDMSGSAWAIYYLALIAFQQGEYSNATELLRESLELSWKIGHKTLIVLSLVGLADQARMKNNVKRAARLWGSTPVFTGAEMAALLPAARESYESTRITLESLVHDIVCERAWAEGQAMTLEQAIAYALEQATDDEGLM